MTKKRKSLTSHTIGHWKFNQSLNALQPDYVVTGEFQAIATLCGRTESSLPNARLISMAPELLEAVKDALMMCRKHGIDSTWECALEKVIAKATGGDL